MMSALICRSGECRPSHSPNLQITKPFFMVTTLDRRQWLKTAGAALAGVALTSQVSKLRAQHEVDKSAARAEPIKINGNENPFGPSPAAIAAIMHTVDISCPYPF